MDAFGVGVYRTRTRTRRGGGNHAAILFGQACGAGDRDRMAMKSRDDFFTIEPLAAGTAARRLGNASLLILVYAFAKFALQFGSTIVIARLVPPAEFGIASLAMPAVFIAVSLSQFGLAQPIMQLPVVTHRLVNTLFWINVALGLAFGAAVAGLAVPAVWFYGEPRVGAVFVVLGASVVFAGLSTQFAAILRRRLLVQRVETANLVAFVGSIAVAVVAALLGASYWAVVLQQILLPVITVAVLAPLAGWRPTAPWDISWHEAKGSIKFGGHLTIFGLAQQLAGSLPTIVAGRVFSPAMAGIYYRSATLAALVPGRIVSPLSGAFIPTLSRLQDDPEAYRAIFGRMITRMNLMLMPVAVLLASSSDLVVRLLLGPSWAEAAPVLAWMSINTMQAAAQGFMWALIASGASREIMRYGIGGAVTSAVAVLAGAQFGLVTMAALYMLSGLFIRIPVLCRLMVRHTPVDLRTILRSYIADIVLAVAFIGVLIGVRRLMADVPDMGQLVTVAALITAAYVARIVLDPALGRDVATALGKITLRRRA